MVGFLVLGRRVGLAVVGFLVLGRCVVGDAVGVSVVGAPSTGDATKATWRSVRAKHPIFEMIMIWVLVSRS